MAGRRKASTITVPTTVQKHPLVGYHDLTVEDAAQIDEMLRSGKTPTAVAKHIQKVLKKATTVTQIAVLMKIRDYRDNHLSKSIVLAASLLKPEVAESAANRIDMDLDVLGELTGLIYAQKMRVESMLQWEGHKKDFYKYTSSNIRLLGELLVQAGNLQMDLGLLKRKPKKVEADINFTSEDRKKVFESMSFHDQTAAATAEVLRLISNSGNVVEMNDPAG